METINWVLIGVIVIIGGCAWKGKRAGFIKSAFSACSTMLSIVGAVILGPIVKMILPDNPILSYVLAYIVASIGLSIVCSVLELSPVPFSPFVLKKQWQQDPEVRDGYYLDQESLYNGFDRMGFPYQRYLLIKLHPSRDDWPSDRYGPPERRKKA